VKLRNPEDEKYFKDITLNNILDEISKENLNANLQNISENISPNTPHQPLHQSSLEEEVFYTKPISYQREKNSPILFYLQIIFLGILPLLLLIFFFLPSKPEPTVLKTTQTPISSTLHQNLADTKKEKLPVSTVVPAKSEQRETIEVHIQKPKIKQAPKTKTDLKSVREEAKKALLHQMKTK